MKHALTRPLSLNIHTLIANPKLPGIMLSQSNIYGTGVNIRGARDGGGGGDGGGGVR